MGNQDLHNVCSTYDIEVTIYQASELSGSSVVWIPFLEYCDSGHRHLNQASDEQDMWNTGEPRNANKILAG